VVADGDGVIVVPADVASEVAVYARRELTRDRKSRGKLYRALGLEPDDTVD
jgi:regulator of RNase E activity RraA